ncbi:MAG TPA: MerR family DNA-binding transcriptional regulator [Planctomycetaceae bacterium]|nr:MerR family DNA-binding transcriptional regulator [Planctomycetaceae bacterium]|tara:strand:- start:255 stop:485 length:231 start_codon:yes stop_codon:yes gene_type:complete
MSTFVRSGEFVTVKDAAHKLGVAPNTIRAWGAAGKLSEYRHPMNNYRLYKQSDLESVVEQLEASLMPSTDPKTSQT